MGKKSRKKHDTRGCKYLGIDVFGHPYCTAKDSEHTKCKFRSKSDEYIEMKLQQEMFKDMLKDGGMPFVLSEYKCSLFKDKEDKNGHLPESMRPGLDEGFHSITVDF